MDYGIMQLPYFAKGSLINFLCLLANKAIQRGILTQEELTFVKKYFIKKEIGTLHELLLHTQMAHGDVKPDNYVLADDFTLRLIDFSSMASAYEKTNKAQGTISYNPPEYF